MIESSTIMREGFTAADCAERELAQRRRAYSRWVKAKRMTQALADRQTALMQATARKFRPEDDAEGADDDLFGRSNGVLKIRSPAPAQKHRGEHPQAQAECEQPDQQAELRAIGGVAPGKDQQDFSDKCHAGKS
jgi:hypothetical protein